jgi:hypothetical protein
VEEVVVLDGAQQQNSYNPKNINGSYHNGGNGHDGYKAVE